MFKHEFLQQIPLFAVGALNQEETEKIREHLDAGCEICDAELRQFSDDVSRLPFGLKAHPLPEKLKGQILQKIDVLSPPATVFPWWKVLAIAAVLALISLAGWKWQEQKELLQKSEKDLAEMRILLEKQKEQIEWLRTPSVQMALLRGIESAAGSRAKILYNPDAGRGVLYVDSLSPLSPDKTYQLWVIGSGGPVSAGVFQPDKQGTAILMIPPIQNPPHGVQFAVTIEPHGGVPQPTGSMVLAGTPL